MKNKQLLSQLKYKVKMALYVSTMIVCKNMFFQRFLISKILAPLIHKTVNFDK